MFIRLPDTHGPQMMSHNDFADKDTYGGVLAMCSFACEQPTLVRVLFGTVLCCMSPLSRSHVVSCLTAVW